MYIWRKIMSEKLWKQMEIDFLKQICNYKGAIEVNILNCIMREIYNLSTYQIDTNIRALVDKQYIIIEKIRKLDGTESKVAFVTEKGAEILCEKKIISAKKVITNRMTYELKCDGYSSFSEWLENNRQKLVLEEEITRMFSCVLADIETMIIYKDDEKEIENILNMAIERMNHRAEKSPECSSSVEYAVVMTIYNKIIELKGIENMIKEACNARKIIRAIMEERHATAVEFI